MQYRRFGKLGWNVASVGFGAWAVGASWGEQPEDESIAAMNRAIDLGCNFIDTAQGYGDGRSERIIARVLAERPRDRVYVATKIPPAPGNWPPLPHDRVDDRYGPAYLRERLERSLRDLKTDCIDLLQLHTWTRAWNRNPTPFDTLRQFKKEGKIRGIGISTPEHDQNALVDLVRGGHVDSIQVIYNIFEQEPAAELLPACVEAEVGVIARMPFDEGALTGKYKPGHIFPEGDFRRNYFAGDRLDRALARAAKVAETIGRDEPDIATAALKFALKGVGVSTIIPGIRNVRQADMNLSASDAPPMTDAVEARLRPFTWRRAFWYSGK